MHTRNLLLALLSTSCLLLVGCETTKPPEKLAIEKPVYYKKARRAVNSQVAQAILLLEQAKYSEASSYINQTLQTHPQNTKLHILNALTYEKLAESGDPIMMDLAITGYQNALSIEPSLTFAMIQLGKIKYNMQKYEEAQEHFANALLLRPKDTNLLQEFAAASYYAYDIKSAFGAIQKALKLKPEDPLIHRSAAMMYAAMGDFKNSETHCKLFQASVGQNPDVDNVTNRFYEWQDLYKSGRIKLAAGPGGGPGGSATSSGDLVDLPPQGPFPGGPGGPGGAPGAIVEAAPLPEPEPTKQQVICDVYMVEIHEEASSSKGSNILNNLAVTLSPGSYVKFNGKGKGSGLFPGPATSPSTGDTAVVGAANGSGIIPNAAGGLNTAISNGTFSSTINTIGNFSGYVFTRGITWAGLTYSLNIANATDNRIELISRPTMLTHLNKETRFFSGTELANVTSGSIGSGLSRYQIGVQVTVLPQTLVGDMVSMDVALETSNSTEVRPNLKETVSVAKTRLETTVRMRLGETVLLGGLYKRMELQGKSGVPGLRDMPFVQYFFANETTDSIRDSIALLITPRSPDVVRSAVSRAMAQESVRPNVDELSVRNPDWFHPRPNAVNIFNYLNLDPTIYYEFRTGDILPPSWGYEPALSDKLNELSSFLYF